MDLIIEGMHCGACATRIERTLSRKPEVKNAHVNYATRKARVEGALSFDEVSAFVADLGYKVHLADGTDPSPEASVERNEFILSAVLTLPVFVLGMFHINFPGSGYIQLIFTATLIAFPGRQFFTRAATLLTKKTANMDTLIALGVSASFLSSVSEVIKGTHQYYFEAAAVIVCFVLLGRYLETRARGSAVAVVDSLKQLGAKEATVLLADGSSVARKLSDLVVGDVVRVSPGERIPLDGTVVRGTSIVDESLISGEPLPKEKRPHEQVISSTVNVGNEVIDVRCDKTEADSLFSKVVTLVEDAQSTKAQIQRLADSVSGYFVPIVIAAAILTLLVHVFFLSIPFSEAIYYAVAVLVVACPCALGLATPVAILVGTGRAATNMILIKTAAGLERTVSVDTVIFDKTGTLTHGAPTVVEMIPFGNGRSDSDDRELLAIIGSVERQSKHPLAMAIVNYVESLDIETKVSVETTEHFGRGIEARVKKNGSGSELLAGNVELMTERDVEGLDLVDPKKIANFGVIYCAFNKKLVAVFLVDDPVRADAADVIKNLHALGIQVVMATGDRKEVATRIAEATGIDEVYAGQMPADKLKLVQKFESEGRTVAMVGDGINDAPSLAAAAVGVAMGNGADIALDAADLIIPDGSIGKLSRAVEISRRTLRTIKQNLFWAFAYNILAIPIAASGKLSPMVAAAAMGISSLSVVLNSLRLKRA